MKLIISTYKDCFVYDINNHTYQQIHRPTSKKKRAYGISWWKNKLFIAWRKPNEILEYDQNLQPTGRYLTGTKLGDLHQITCFDNKIWVTNTGKNCISIFNASTLKFIDNWFPHQQIIDDDNPFQTNKNHKNFYKHYNSIMLYKQKLYINAHMTNKNPPSKVWEFKYPSLKFIQKIPGGQSSHNIFFIKNKLHICNSAFGSIIQPKTNTTIFQSDHSSFLRGVSMPGSMLIIGRSDLITDKNNRHSGNGGLIIFKKHNFNNPTLIPICKGPIHEIRCLNIHDEAHPTNIFI